MYVGWRDLTWARGRFALITSTVVLITVLVGLLTGLTRGLGRESTSAITGLQAQSLVLGADTFDASQVSPTAVPGAEPLGIATVQVQAPGGVRAMALFGVPERATFAPGADAVQRDEVVLSAGASDDWPEPLTTWDEKRVSIAGRDLAARTSSVEASYAHLPVVWVEYETWRALTGHDAPTALVLTDDSPGALPAGLLSFTPEQAVNAIGSYTSENGSLRLIQGFLVVISALVVGAFFTVWTMQRRSDVAVLKALGATTRSVLTDALGQAAVVLALGAALGAAIALAVGQIAATAVPFDLDLVALLPSLGVLLALALLGAALAVRQVVRVDPLLALNGR